MNTTQTFNILFWIKKSRTKNGSAPLFARITINGDRNEISTNRMVPILNWDAAAQKVTGRNDESREINDHITIIRNKLLKCYDKLEIRGETITAEAIKDEYIGKRIERKKVLEAFIFHMDRMEKEVEQGVTSKATYNKYEDTLNHLKSYISKSR